MVGWLKGCLFLGQLLIVVLGASLGYPDSITWHLFSAPQLRLGN